MPSLNDVLEKELKDVDAETRKKILEKVDEYISPDAIGKAAQAAKAEVIQEKLEKLRVAYIAEMTAVKGDEWTRTKAVREIQARYRSQGLDTNRIGFS